MFDLSNVCIQLCKKQNLQCRWQWLELISWMFLVSIRFLFVCSTDCWSWKCLQGGSAVGQPCGGPESVPGGPELELECFQVRLCLNFPLLSLLFCLSSSSASLFLFSSSHLFVHFWKKKAQLHLSEELFCPSQPFVPIDSTNDPFLSCTCLTLHGCILKLTCNMFWLR